MTEKIFESPGASTLGVYIWQIAAILLGAFVLGYVFRLLLNSKLKSRISALDIENQMLTSKMMPEISEADIETLNKKIREYKTEADRLNTKLSDCFANRMKAEHDLSSLQEKYNILSSSVSTQKKEPIEETKSTHILSASVAGSDQKDDLKKIEGIGPKIEELLNADGIHTFEQLIESTVGRIRGILIAAGPNYAVHDPSTWAEQADLANTEQWEGLDSLQEELKGGKRT
ncbi:MAG: putative flap endonuclease-1-like 5' DNA nuclease [Bacteroidia bacterium]|jgi:predicted flap endonuclease-1-like 5' DNA nuclease|tara:strand:- start:19606 stop:20295 length:690 start_codon:yes stop_codon:yes gene_type:complete